MKIILSLLIIMNVEASAQNGFYDNSVAMLNGNILNLSNLKNSKVLVAAVSASKLIQETFKSLDSLQSVRPDLKIIIVPDDDFSTVDDSILMSIASSFDALEPMITVGLSVRKINGENQDKLFQWLTNASLNQHFDQDVVSDNQWFLIDENGQLYAVLETLGDTNFINELLDQKALNEQ